MAVAALRRRAQRGAAAPRIAGTDGAEMAPGAAPGATETTTQREASRIGESLGVMPPARSGIRRRYDGIDFDWHGRRALRGSDQMHAAGPRSARDATSRDTGRLAPAAAPRGPSGR